MKSRAFHFEIKDVITQFIAAFDDIVIGRYNKNRSEVDKINVRYVYAPKQRVMYDIINENKTITLPVVAVSIKSVARDTSRVFNKLDGFYYSGTSGEEKTSRHIKAPVPVNITVGVSILSRYQTDLDQILSNFIPFANPYVVISWKVPEAFNLSVDQEIRSEVLWDGNVGLNYPTELNASQKARITADTSFTIKGWLFKDEDEPVGNIFYIDQNFNAVDLISDYDGMASASLPTESFELSGSPHITDIFYNGVKLYGDVTLTTSQVSSTSAGTILLNGTGFTNTETVLFSSTNDSMYSSLTSLPATTRQSEISGQSIPFTILNDNIISLNMPVLTGGTGSVRFIPYNKAGYSFSDTTLETQTFSGNTTFIKVN